VSEQRRPFELQPVLRGELIELRPLKPEDFPALYAVASDPLIWEQHPASDRYEKEVFEGFFREALASGGALIALDAKDGRVIGSSRFHGFDPDRSEIEIGWTFLARSYWGGVYNREMKRLMLTHALRFVDRVVFLVGPKNWRSRKAMEKIGGILAGERTDRNGRVSVVYEITSQAFRDSFAPSRSGIITSAIALALFWGGLGFALAQGENAARQAEFVRARGEKLVLGSKAEEVRLRGVAFTPRATANPRREDYEAVRRMGMNTVLLALNDRSFSEASSARSEAWDRIDAHIRFARANGIRLVLFLLGIEGAQFVPGTEPFDYRIWEEDKLQQHYLRLWRSIADRYSHEPQIAGFAIFGEPVTSGSAEQWSKLAARASQTIREVDKNHAIFVERVYGENRARREVSGTDLPPERAFPLVSDGNVVYMFYFFERDEYTHQFAPWRPELQKSLRYPDAEHLISYEEPGGLRRRFGFERGYLEFYLKRQLEFGRAHQAPMFVWGGALKGCFTREKGGLDWLTDVVSLFEANHLQWVLWAYRDDNFGIDENEAIKRLLAERLSRSETNLESLRNARD
jgi:RimJ/RimL family protein N-acetyltransferase